jgi:hypothetical protein
MTQTTSSDSPGRRRFRWLWLAPVLALVALSAWAFASPVGSSPDDDFHQVSIWCANSARTDLCRPGTDALHRSVPDDLVQTSCYAHRADKSAACTQKVLASSRWVETTRGNFSGYYPPVYYAVANLFASPDVAASVVVIRIVNSVLFLGLSVLLWWLLPRSRGRVLLIAWAVSVVPLGMFLIPSVNPSSWSIIGVGLGWLAVLGFLEAETVARRWALGGVMLATFVMAAGSRPDAAIYWGIGAVVGSVIALRRERRYWLLVIAPVVLSALGLASYLLSSYAGVAVTGIGGATSAMPGGAAAPDPGADRGLLSLLFHDLIEVPSLWAGILGTWGLGWFDTAMPTLVWFATLLCFGGVLFGAFAKPTPRIAGLMIGVLAMLWVIPTAVLVAGHDLVGVNVQPRYLLPLWVVFAGLAVLAWERSGRRVGRWQAGVLVVALGLANSLALFTDLRRYVKGDGVGGFLLEQDERWWWNGLGIPPTAIWLLGSLAFVVAVLVLVREWRRGRGDAAQAAVESAALPITR